MQLKSLQYEKPITKGNIARLHFNTLSYMYGFMELLEFMVAQFFMVFVESPPPGI